LQILQIHPSPAFPDSRVSCGPGLCNEVSSLRRYVIATPFKLTGCLTAYLPVNCAQAYFGSSPQDWLNEQRLIRAGKLLKQLRSVKSVAFPLGFKQVSHFSREFKFQYGIAPATFLLWNDNQMPARSNGADGRPR